MNKTIEQLRSEVKTKNRKEEKDYLNKVLKQKLEQLDYFEKSVATLKQSINTIKKELKEIVK